MVKLFGTPTAKGAWGEGEDATPGLCKWNGQTGSDGRFGGAVEITVRALPPRPRQGSGSGFWNATYQLTDIDEPGAAAKVAEESAAKLAAKYRAKAKPASETARKAAEKAASKASKATESAE